MIFAPHNDDEVLGVGGTIANYAKASHEVVICEVTVGDINKPDVQYLKKEAIKAHDILGVTRTIFMDLPVVALKEVPTKQLNKRFLEIVQDISPDVVFLPHKGDMHTDHRIVNEAAMVALRPVSCPKLRAIYAYETLSETEWNIPNVENAFIPTVYSDISETIELKLGAMKCYGSQLCEYPHPRSLKAMKALAMYRGSTICTPYAEAFMCIREIMSI